MSALLYVMGTGLGPKVPGVDFRCNPLYPGSPMSSGMILVVQPVGTSPDLSLGMNISPGMETTVIIEATLRNRLSQPYSDCTTESIVGDKDGMNRSCSECNCLDVCAQQHVINKCGCFDIDI